MKHIDSAPLAHYISDLEAILASNLAVRPCLQRVQERLERLLAEGELNLDLPTPAPDAPCQERHLVHCDPEGRFAVLALVWPPGADSQAHDHGTWGAVGVVEGELQVEDYERVDGGERGDEAELQLIRTFQAKPGMVATVLPPHDEIHRMRNTSDRVTVTLHTYGREIRECQLFDAETGRPTLVKPKYRSMLTVIGAATTAR